MSNSNHYEAFCTTHDRQWKAATPTEDCPWCEIDKLRNEIEAAKKALGGFAGPPFDGSLECGIKAISMRCGTAERRIKELTKSGARLEQDVHELEERFSEGDE